MELIAKWNGFLQLLRKNKNPKDSKIVKRFIKALTEEKILENEFSINNPEIVRFKERFIGNGCGWGLQLLIDTVIPILGYGDEHCQSLIKASLNTFDSITSVSSILDVAKYNSESKKKYNYPYLESNQLWPCLYHLETLAYNYSWRDETSKKKLSKAINHLNKITPHNNWNYCWNNNVG